MTTVQSLVNALGNLFALLGAAAGWYFVYRYAQADWREYEAGRQLMKFILGLSVVLTYVVVYQVIALYFDPNPTLDFIVHLARVGIFGWVTWQLFALVRTLRYYQSGRYQGIEGDTRHPMEHDQRP